MCSYQTDELYLDFFSVLEEPIESYSCINFDHVVPLTWREKPMKDWSSSEVLDFISYETSQIGLFLNLDRFKCISGYIFQNLNKEHCQILTQCAKTGEIIFNVKENYISKEIYDNNIPATCSEENTSEKITCEVENIIPKKIGRPRSICKRRKSEKKSKRLWEFLLHLLNDQKTCPEIIKWENFEEGTFKFVKSETVAQLWGSRNHNQTMTYEKFTRAIRYHYKSQILLPVPGKKLVYKFGPHAKGWNQYRLPYCS